MTDRNFFEFLRASLDNNLIFRNCTMDRERVVSSIMALLFLFIAICKAQRFRFLTLYLVFALLATRIKRLQERRRRRGALLSKTEASAVGYIRDRKDGLKKCIEIRSYFRYGKNPLELTLI